MANLREESLNSLLALLLELYEGIDVAPDRTDASTAMDITVVRAGAADTVPHFTQAKAGDRPSRRWEAAEQTRPQLRSERRAHTFALCYPSQLGN